MLSLITTAAQLLHREQHGQVLWLVAGLLSVFGGMTAIAVDLGSYSAARRDLQNSADAIALAAALELPSTGEAQAVAYQWAAKNGIDASDLTVTIVPQNLPSQPNPEVQVQVQDEHNFVFARLIGIQTASVASSAAAIKTSPSGGPGMVPLSVTVDALSGAAPGDPVVLKYDANNITEGNTSPIRIDGPGTGNCNHNDQFCTGVKYGSESTVCAQGTDTTYCSGPTTVDTQPGNLVGGIREAIEWRMDETDVLCDEFTETFEDDPTSSDPGLFRITQECNPFLAGGYDSLQIIIVPVIKELCNGSCVVTIVEFALFYLEGFGNGGCIGNDCEVIGSYVRVNQNIGLLAGTFDPDSFNNFVRLVQ